MVGGWVDWLVLEGKYYVWLENITHKSKGLINRNPKAGSGISSYELLVRKATETLTG